MRTLITFVVVAIVLSFAPLVTATGTPAAAFNVGEEKDFAEYRMPLITFLRSRHVTHATHVCILGGQASDGSKWAWAIWKGGKTMILWGGGESSMTSSRRILDLRRDVVASETDLRGSTYLVTQEWVTTQQTQCKQYGTQVYITAKELAK